MHVENCRIYALMNVLSFDVSPTTGLDLPLSTIPLSYVRLYHLRLWTYFEKICDLTQIDTSFLCGELSVDNRRL